MDDRVNDYYIREQLYAEIWIEPMTVVSKRYGVSDVYLARICKELHVPRPPVGYWAKKQFNKAPAQTPLPLFANPPKFRKHSIQSFSSVEIDSDPILVPDAFEEAYQLAEKEKLPSMHIVVASSPQKLHPMVQKTKDSLAKHLKNVSNYEYGRVSTHATETFNVSIGPSSVDRVLRILQSFALACEARGYPIVSGSSTNSKLKISIMGECIGFLIFEPSKKMELPPAEAKNTYHSYKYVPTGKLQFSITDKPWRMSGQTMWEDSKRGKIEEKLNSILIGFYNAAAWRKELAEYWRQEEVKREIEREQEAERERLILLEKDRVIRLESEYRKWRHHLSLVKYIKEVERHYKNQEENNADYRSWLVWVHEYANNLNPMKNSPPQLKQ
jgi:hypothetical protein